MTAPGPSGGDMLRAITTIRRDPLAFLATAGDLVLEAADKSRFKGSSLDSNPGRYSSS